MIAAIPYLLGFVPDRSVVAMGLQEPTHRVTVTARIDLPPTNAQATELADALVVGLLRSGAGSACLVFYWDDSDEFDDEDRDDVTASIVGVFADAGLPVRCCLQAPAPGETVSLLHAGPIPDLALASVVNGRQVLASRREVERRVGAVRDPNTQWIELALRGLGELDLPVADLEVASGSILRSAKEATAAGVTRPVLSPDEVATVCLALRCIGIRDRLLGRLCRDSDAAYDDILAQICQTAPGDQVAPAAAVLAVAAYLRGNGVLARCAVDRALSVEPTYSLAGLLEIALDNALPPEGLRQAFGGAGIVHTLEPETSEVLDPTHVNDG